MTRRRDAAPTETETLLTCVECGAVSEASARGWRAYIGGGHEDDGPVEVGTFCPDCSKREFESD